MVSNNFIILKDKKNCYSKMQIKTYEFSNNKWKLLIYYYWILIF